MCECNWLVAMSHIRCNLFAFEYKCKAFGPKAIIMSGFICRVNKLQAKIPPDDITIYHFQMYHLSMEDRLLRDSRWNACAAW